MSNSLQIKRIAIVGGGTAGWMAASILARALPGTGTVITVIESPDIGTVGVGEATIPPIMDLLRFLNVNEGDFVRHTQSTYKLGIKFTDWLRIGESYWHPFGTFGSMINLRPLFHAWHKARADGRALRFNDFSLCATLGDARKFRFPDPASQDPAAGLRYALHFDATLVAKYLRSYAERLGVTRIERKVVGATRRADGLLDELQFSDSSTLRADLYIDCSGFRGVLIEEIMGTGYLDWSAMLPCDRAVAFPTVSTAARPPYTNSLGERPLSDPRFLRFVTGRRKLLWNRNCVALGLASGFLEPLESTSIHMVMSGVYKLLEHFPDRSFDQANIDSYNSELIAESERIRDFIVLHYCLTQREDAPLWAYCRSMMLPDSLMQRIELYRRTGRIRVKAGELFTDLSWFYIFEGLGVRPDSYDPLMDVVTAGQLGEIMASMAAATAAAAKAAPSHDSYFAANTTTGSRAAAAP